MGVFPRIAELSVKAARQAGTLALSLARTVAEQVQQRRSDDEASGWTRSWEPASSRPVGEPPPPPSAPRKRPPAATAPAVPAPAVAAPAAPVSPRPKPPAAAAPPVAPVSPQPKPPAAAAPPAAPVRPQPKPPAAAEPPVSPPPTPPTPSEPAHIDRDAVVVAASADTEAAEGAGAAISVAEPWEGYSRLNVKDIRAQLATANAATLAVVRLYESSHRKRRTVLAEVDRRLAADGG